MYAVLHLGCLCRWVFSHTHWCSAPLCVAAVYCLCLSSRLMALWLRSTPPFLSQPVSSPRLRLLGLPLLAFVVSGSSWRLASCHLFSIPSLLVLTPEPRQSLRSSLPSPSHMVLLSVPPGARLSVGEQGVVETLKWISQHFNVNFSTVYSSLQMLLQLPAACICLLYLRFTQIISLLKNFTLHYTDIKALYDAAVAQYLLRIFGEIESGRGWYTVNIEWIRWHLSIPNR